MRTWWGPGVSAISFIYAFASGFIHNFAIIRAMARGTDILARNATAHIIKGVTNGACHVRGQSLCMCAGDNPVHQTERRRFRKFMRGAKRVLDEDSAGERLIRHRLFFAGNLRVLRGFERYAGGGKRRQRRGHQRRIGEVFERQ